MVFGAYTEKYKEQCFYQWYELDRPGVRKLEKLVRPDENGRTPSKGVLDEWMITDGWRERADGLDGQLSIQLDEEVISARQKMFLEHAEAGKLILDKGMKYFAEHQIEDAGDALKAIQIGVEIQRISVGQAQAWAKISTMTDEQITKELMRLAGKSAPESEFNVDADVVEEDVVEEDAE